MNARAKADFSGENDAGLREAANTYKSGVYWDGTQGRGGGGRSEPSAGRGCTWCRCSDSWGGSAPGADARTGGA